MKVLKTETIPEEKMPLLNAQYSELDLPKLQQSQDSMSVEHSQSFPNLNNHISIFSEPERKKYQVFKIEKTAKPLLSIPYNYSSDAQKDKQKRILYVASAGLISKTIEEIVKALSEEDFDKMQDSGIITEERFTVSVLADIHKVVTQLYREEGKGRRC